MPAVGRADEGSVRNVRGVMMARVLLHLVQGRGNTLLNEGDLLEAPRESAVTR